MSLEARLKNLHHLLGVSSFSRWPLHLRFFAPDVFTQWERHMLKMKSKLRDSVTIQLTPAELPKLAADVQLEMRTHFIPEVIRAIPVTYEDCKLHIEKTSRVLDSVSRHSCGVCNKEATGEASLVLVCPVESCTCISHMSCLAARFLQDERNKDALIPIEGSCPRCRSPIRWSTMMQELSLRLHGEEELKTLFKPSRLKKSDWTTQAEPTDPQDLDDPEDEDLDETWMEDVNEDEDKSLDSKNT